MAHRVAPEAEVDLDGIWYYIATESGSIHAADQCIDSLTDRFYLLAGILYRIDKEEEVLILHVVRGSRNIEALFGR